MTQIEFIELFNSLGSWQDKFQYLIDLGSELPEMPEHLKNRSTLISACNSRTYFRVTTPEGIIHIEGWSNASIPSGMIMILKTIFDGISIKDLPVIDFHLKTELIDNLTKQRKAALYEMINRVQHL